MTGAPLFVFGTMLDLDVLEIVLGRSTSAIGRRAASLAGFARMRLVDDRVETADDLDPAQHFVLVTPDESRAIAGRLAARGFAEGHDVTTLRAIEAEASCSNASSVRLSVSTTRSTSCLRRV